MYESEDEEHDNISLSQTSLIQEQFSAPLGKIEYVYPGS